MSLSVSTSDRRFTYGDYLTWPENQRCELIDGVIYDMTPAPSRTHSNISIAILRQLLPFFEGKPCEVHNAPFDVRLPVGQEPDDEIATVVQPDILVVCDQVKLDEKGCRGAPDLVIEILSPSTASKDHIVKRWVYERHGVKEYWLVSPTDRIVIIYHLDGNGVYGKPDVHGDDATVAVALFPGLSIDLAKVFPALPQVVREPPTTYL